jgi:hypothetical protein
LTERTQDLSVDCFARGWPCGGGQDQHVRIAGQFQERRAKSVWGLFRSRRAISDGAAKTFKPSGDCTPNLSETKYAVSSPGNLSSQTHLRSLPEPFPDMTIRLRDTSHRRNHQAYSEIRYIVSQNIGRVGDSDAATPRPIAVDPLVPDSCDCDDSQRRKPIQ